MSPISTLYNKAIGMSKQIFNILTNSASDLDYLIETATPSLLNHHVFTAIDLINRGES